MIIYEVSLSAEAAIAQPFLAWLRSHIAEMLALPGFVDAQLYRVDDPVESDRCGWCVAYRLRDRAALDSYLDEHAAGMREDGLRRFGGRFRASRRILDPTADQG
jgi:quinol monooxygenase YgiN